MPDENHTPGIHILPQHHRTFCGITLIVCGTGIKGVVVLLAEALVDTVTGGKGQLPFPFAPPVPVGPGAVNVALYSTNGGIEGDAPVLFPLRTSSDGSSQVVTVEFGTTPSQTLELPVKEIRTFSVRFMLFTKTIAQDLSGFWATKRLNWLGVRWLPSLPLRTR